MAIVPQKAPAAATALIRATLGDLDGGRSLLGGAVDLMSEPFALYTVDAARLRGGFREGRAADAFVAVGWRSVLAGDAGEPRLADVKGRGDSLRFARIVSGPRVAALVEAAALADAEIEAGDYALRIVETAELKVAAIWLAGATPRFIPFAGLPIEPMSERAFFLELRARARADAPGGFARAGFATGLAVTTLAAAAALALHRWKAKS